jgi:hypothetical protein
MPRTTTYASRLPFVVDQLSLVRDDGRQIDWASIPSSYRINTSAATVTVDTAGASANATSVPVLATTVALPSGTLLDFGGKKVARLSAAAAIGATTLTVDAIPTALVSGDVATVIVTGSLATGRFLPAGTVLAELTSGKCVPRSVAPSGVTATGILETDAYEFSTTDALTGYGVLIGGALYENMLPEATGGPPKTINSTWKTELQTAGVGTGFAFRVYGNSIS